MAAAQVIVELTGDERRVLEAYRKTEAEDRKLRESTVKTGAAGADASKLFSQSWLEAQKGSAKGMEGLLRELRKSGVEGQTAAKAVETHMQSAGKAGRRSMAEILETIGGIDEESAKVARLMVDHMRTGSRESVKELGKLGVPLQAIRRESDDAGQSIIASMVSAKDGALPELARISEGVGGIGTGLFQIAGAGGAAGALLGAFKLIGDAIASNHEQLIATRDLAINVSQAQQDAVGNMVGVAVVDQNEILSKRLPELAVELGVDGGALGDLKAALGAAYSAVGNLPDAEAAVRAAAAVSSANPGAIRAKAAAALDLQRATGIDDAERNLALLGTASTVARVDNPELFANTLSKAVSQMVSMIPEQNRELLAVDTAAMFSTLTLHATDVTGEESKTGAIQFAKRLDDLFDKLPEVAMEARDKLAKLTEANTLSPTQAVDLQKLELKQVEFTSSLAAELRKLTLSDPARDARMEALRDKPIKNRTKAEKDELNQLEKEEKQLAALKRKEFTASDFAKVEQLKDRSVFSEMEQKQKAELEALIQAASKTLDPKDFRKRIEAIQQSPALAEKLYEKPIGGELLSGVFEQLRDPNSAFSKDFFENISKITTSKADFQTQALAANSATPAMLTGFLKRSGSAAENIAKLGQPGDALGIQIEENVSNILAATRREGIVQKSADYVGEAFRPEVLPGQFALSKMQSAKFPLLERRNALISQNQSLGGDPELEAKIKALDLEIEAFDKTVTGYLQMLRDGRITVRPGEIEEATRLNRQRQLDPSISGAFEPGSGGPFARATLPNLKTLLTPAGREEVQRQAAMLEQLQAVRDTGDQPISLPRTAESSTTPEGQRYGFGPELDRDGTRANDQEEQRRTTAKQLETQERIARAMESQNQMIADQNRLLQQTVNNTQPGPADPLDYDAIYEASFRQQDARTVDSF